MTDRRLFRTRWAGSAIILAVLCSAVVLLLRDPSTEAEPEQLIVLAWSAVRQGDYELAEQLAARVDRADRHWSRAQLVAGEAATKAERHEEALEYYAAVEWSDSETGILAAYSYAEVCREIGRLTDAERAYRRVLELDPSDSSTHGKLAFLLGVTGRRWESRRHFMALVRNGDWDLDSLVLLGDLDRPMEQGEYVRRCADYAPRDLLVQQALAAHAVAEGEATEARQTLQSVVEQAPHAIAAQAMLGELLVDADETIFLQWHAALPVEADEHPDIWFVRGLWARRQGRHGVAARCFWETVRRTPCHRRGNYHLGQMLVSLNETSGAEFANRSSQLARLTQTLDDVLRTRGQYEPFLQRVTELMEEGGRVREAWAWATTAAETFPNSTWPRETVARLSLLLNDDLPRTLDSANLAMKFDLSRFPDHSGLVWQVDPAGAHVHDNHSPSSIRFEEAVDTGIDFAYVNGHDASTTGTRMFEQTGGGVAVLDVDRDGRPDLYFTQGAAWRHGAPGPEASADLTDRFYRNLSSQSFHDATAATRLGNENFGQGCAVGDFDNDGFPDLYVGNIGRNRLYRNNGDGTFSDFSEECGLEGGDWTSSCLISDLNADGLPDLFDVNYLTGPQVHELICNGRGCSPSNFDGVPDRLHLNLGDGRFKFIAEAVSGSNAKGLGVVAASIHHRGRPCLFIANDQVPNFLYRNDPVDNRFRIALREEGFISGLAYNTDGLPMGCMGIAADDVDGNGLIDFFVTNFHDESNTLYRQDLPGLFVDATTATGLRAPSWPMVGWGTQFLDADLDGDADLIVTNGHVDDYRDEGGEYHMRPQFFENIGRGRFVERLADEAGEYFGQKFLGRGLARLDWNRDGRMDFVVSNIGDRASLVTNESIDTGHFVNVRLHATATARDAIGTDVEVVTGERRWRKQLLAGDGFQASNERLLQFGLGDETTISELRVEWPSGAITTIPDPPVDVTIELVEASRRGVLWRGTKPESLSIPNVGLSYSEVAD